MNQPAEGQFHSCRRLCSTWRGWEISWCCVPHWAISHTFNRIDRLQQACLSHNPWTSWIAQEEVRGAEQVCEPVVKGEGASLNWSGNYFEQIIFPNGCRMNVVQKVVVGPPAEWLPPRAQVSCWQVVLRENRKHHTAAPRPLMLP